MKKLIFALLAIAALQQGTSLYAGDTGKKVAAFTKIILGSAGIPVSFFCVSQAFRLPRVDLWNEEAIVEPLRRNNAASSVFFTLPLSIIALQSGLKDLKDLKKNNIIV